VIVSFVILVSFLPKLLQFPQPIEITLRAEDQYRILSFCISCQEERVPNRSSNEPLKPLIFLGDAPSRFESVREHVKPLGFSLITAGEAGALTPVASGRSLLETASLRAHLVAEQSGLPAIADYSGLCFDCTYYGTVIPRVFETWVAFAPRLFEVSDQMNNCGCCGPADRTIALICAAALATPDGQVRATEARIDGQLKNVFRHKSVESFRRFEDVFEPQGYPYRTSASELDPAEWHRISHWTQAYTNLADIIEAAAC
jgi:XTP/dITP diphosphohydrolase